jgi:hypothetical protein
MSRRWLALASLAYGSPSLAISYSQSLGLLKATILYKYTLAILGNRALAFPSYSRRDRSYFGYPIFILHSLTSNKSGLAYILVVPDYSFTFSKVETIVGLSSYPSLSLAVPDRSSASGRVESNSTSLLANRSFYIKPGSR